MTYLYPSIYAQVLQTKPVPKDGIMVDRDMEQRQVFFAGCDYDRNCSTAQRLHHMYGNYIRHLFVVVCIGALVNCSKCVQSSVPNNRIGGQKNVTGECISFTHLRANTSKQIRH